MGGGTSVSLGEALTSMTVSLPMARGKQEVVK